MNIDQTEMLAIVEPDLLEDAYGRYAYLFIERHPGAQISAEGVLDALGRGFPDLEPCDLIDLFRRLCLTVQLVSEIDANWEALDPRKSRPSALPSGFFELAAIELAFEGTTNGHSSTFFARDVFSDAKSAILI